VHSTYSEIALYILVVNLSLSEGCPNSGGYNSPEWSYNSLDNTASRHHEDDAAESDRKFLC